jgi:hypothetical protein
MSVFPKASSLPCEQSLFGLIRTGAVVRPGDHDFISGVVAARSTVGDVQARERVGARSGDAVDGEAALSRVELANSGDRLDDSRMLEVGTTVIRAGLVEDVGVQQLAEAAEDDVDDAVRVSADGAALAPTCLGVVGGCSELADCPRVATVTASGEFDDVDPDEVDDLRAELLTLQQLAPAELQDDYQVLIDAAIGEQVDPSTALQNVEAYHASGCSGTATGG